MAAATLLGAIAGCASPGEPTSSPVTTAASPATSATVGSSGPSVDGGGGLPSGIFDGTYQGLHVAFDLARGRVSNFHADGSWTCASGPAAMMAVIPGSFAVEGNAFTIDTNAQVEGHETHWKITGQFNSAGASGTYSEDSDAACALDGAAWRSQT